MYARSSGKLVIGAAGLAAFAVFLTIMAVLIPAASAHRAASRQEFENCPTHAPESVRRNRWWRAERVLAPHGVRVLNLCRYSSGSTGANGLKLAGNRLVNNPRTIRQLVHKFDALKRYQGPPIHCPGDRGDEVLATLFYRWHQVRIIVSLTGCATAGNGDLTRPAFNFDGRNPAGPALLHQLKHLTRTRHFAV